ncbi:MAG: [Fe-Fe] hydrogenase large subunit C-terminal domain-containing protein [Bacillota bacterium]
MQEYPHSVRLDKDKCKGCTNCIKGCPTQAIRVRGGKASIIAERCIDCGECVRVCPYHAKIAVTDGFESLERFKYRIAVPAPSLYGQFRSLTSIDQVLDALVNIGFDDVWEVARAADIVTEATRKLLKSGEYKRPLISSACPAVVRLIRVRFPSLLQHLSDIDSPMEVAATIAREEFSKKRNVDPKDVGVFFITPCAAKMTSVMNPLGRKISNVDGTISIVDIFGRINAQLGQAGMKRHGLKAGSLPAGVGWASAGGEEYALKWDNHLSVDGIHNIIRLFEEVENGKFSDLDFIEALSCTGGCLGGPLTFENSYVAKMRLSRVIEEMPRATKMPEDAVAYAHSERVHLSERIEPLRVEQLDEDIQKAIDKLERINQLCEILPGLDCGSCGSPNCKTLAEDIVRGDAVELDCIFLLKDKVRYLAQEMVKLASVDNAFEQNDKERG